MQNELIKIKQPCMIHDILNWKNLFDVKKTVWKKMSCFLDAFFFHQLKILAFGGKKFGQERRNVTSLKMNDI